MSHIFKFLILSLFFSQAFAKPQVAITQIVAHPSLDQIRQGILDELIDQKLIQKDLTDVIYQNAQGNITIAAQIAQRFVALDSSVIVAITTPSAQTLAKAIKDTSIPVVFGGVTDPIGAGLVPKLQGHKTRITGTIDLPSPQDQISLIQKILPKVQKIGIIYNPSETNSQKQVQGIKEIAAKSSLIVEEAPAFKTADIAQATAYLVKKVDVILLPNDNTAIAALETIIKTATKGHIPVFASDPESVKNGALAAVANDQYQVGRETGKMIATILKGQDIRKMDIKIIKASKSYFNKKAFKHFKFTYPG